MSDVKLGGAKNDRKKRQQHRKAICSAVPLDFKSETVSETQICAPKLRFSSAC